MTKWVDFCRITLPVCVIFRAFFPKLFWSYIIQKILILLRILVYCMKTITIKDETHAQLTEIGKKGETYDEIIQRLLKGE